MMGRRVVTSYDKKFIKIVQKREQQIKSTYLTATLIIALQKHLNYLKDMVELALA
jgi:hypothetical protein